MRNKYSGNCVRCNAFVGPGNGHPEKNGKRGWNVQCLKCVGKTNTPKTQTQCKHNIYYKECPSYKCKGEETHCTKCDYKLDCDGGCIN